MSKRQLGQFFTTNSAHILQGLEKFIRNKPVVDPFAGAQDLMRWASESGAANVSGFDVDKNLVSNKGVLIMID